MTGSTTIEYIGFSQLYAEPTFSTVKGKEWIRFGDDDLLPNYVAGLLDKSPDHAAIVNGTIQQACGFGLLLPEGNEKAMGMFRNGTTDITANPNDLNSIQAKLIKDLVVHGACLLEVNWLRDVSRTPQVNYVDVASMRLHSVEPAMWLSTDWSNPRKNQPRKFAAFDPAKRSGKQLLYIKAPSARSTPYGMPSYWSARQAIELQHELMTFNLQRVNNSFFASVILSFRDVPGSEERKANHENVKRFFSGSKGRNTMGAAMVYGDGMTVEKYDSAVAPDDLFLMGEVADKQIRAAHRVVGRGALFGLDRTGGGGLAGSREDILNEFEVYYRTVIQPIEQTVTGVWNMLAQIGGVDHSWQIDPFVLYPEEVKEEKPQDVQTLALNGAQVTSLLEIVTQVSSGVLSKETALPLIKAAFPSIGLEQVQAMLDGVINKQLPPANDLII